MKVSRLKVAMGLMHAIGGTDLFLTKTEWQKVHAFPWILQIVSRASNRVFVGAPLCSSRSSPLVPVSYGLSHAGRDQTWLDFNINGPAEIMGIGTLLNLFPEWMLPLVHILVMSR
jgi:hypothetical protein